MEDTLYRCTICGRIGSVGRCCGDETREPLNNLALKEEEKNGISFIRNPEYDEYEGCYTLGKGDSRWSICFKHKPFIFHRLFMKILLGFKWENRKS